MTTLKKVINKYKFERIKNNHRTYFCSSVLKDFHVEGYTYRTPLVSFLLDEHIYLAIPNGIYPNTTYEYYAYFVGEIGGVHYRKDSIMFYKIELANPQ